MSLTTTGRFPRLSHTRKSLARAAQANQVTRTGIAMAEKQADFILQDLEADEVSLVPKAANTHKFLLMKAEDPSAEDKDLAAQFEEEILKAELDEALEKPFEGEDGLQNLVEKGALSPRAMRAVKGAVRLLRGFERELPSDFMDMIRGLMGASQESATAGKKATSRGGPLAKSNEQEDEEMADDVKKTAEELAKEAAPTESKPETPAVADEVTKAKKAAPPEEEEEEEDDEKSKKPPFMKGKGKKEAAKKADDNDFLSSLPEDARIRVESIFKAHADLEAQAAEIKKAQEATARELAAERDARKLEQAIQKAAEEYPNLPVDSKVVGAMVKKAEEAFTKAEVDDLKRVLKAADNAIAESKAFAEANGESFSYGDTASPLSRLKEIAKGLVTKSEKPITEAMAFARAAEQNPGLYDEYLAERRG